MSSDEIIKSGKFFGDQIWMHSECTKYELVSGSPRAREAAVKLLNTWSPQEICAYIDEFGCPDGGFPVLCQGRECYAVTSLQREFSDLRELNRMVCAGRFREINGLEPGNPSGRYSVGFAQVIDPIGRGDDFVTKLVTSSLYAFLVHEITLLALKGEPLLPCARCTKVLLAKRRADAKFCSPACRMARSRELQKSRK
ncbi:hypothetical protein GGE16_001496 [Rhizobium leguminosarum]|uniref:Uncharacterized protein n=1 Tax=Rhizobium leguminosarum TaxID=384 RepID=A0AAE2SVC8_RHILE|nr:hypothetical protein [Rhizobium leguminosarum]MBB4433447.1 hypothetical protein [Rhizobium esperanzae]MBB4294425.1 hypothetical protein [Rhizobium leguminosarum]MBB4305820.1 hypothetical protein [Rhizobium leguminosarum]MBB4418602.1 hypothetical protein [Rhizobium leguminosarum]